MLRSLELFAVALVIIVALVFVDTLIPLPVSLPIVTEESPSATSTPPYTIEASATSTVQIATTTAPKITEPKPKAPEESVVSAVTPPIALPPVLPVQTVSVFNDLNTKTRAALVNIFCAADFRSPFSGTSGSGTIIDPRGVILTSAHIAEFYLIKDYPALGSIECVLRMGSPAMNRYEARLLYLPPSWVVANSAALSQENPSGTGEHDYAFLLITKTTNGDPLPALFPFVSLAVENTPITKGTLVLAGGYAAEFLKGSSLLSNLFALTTITPISELYTFGSSSTDVFALKGALVSEKGSSGGPVVSPDGHVIGLIDTSTAGATTGERQAHAITLPYIHRDFKLETGASLNQLFTSTDLNAAADNFAAALAPGLRDQILSHVKK